MIDDGSIEPGTHHARWDVQAREDFEAALQALVLGATRLDEDVHSWDGIEPAAAALQLRQLQGMLTFAAEALARATGPR